MVTDAFVVTGRAGAVALASPEVDSNIWSVRPLLVVKVGDEAVVIGREGAVTLAPPEVDSNI